MLISARVTILKAALGCIICKRKYGKKLSNEHRVICQGVTLYSHVWCIISYIIHVKSITKENVNCEYLDYVFRLEATL